MALKVLEFKVRFGMSQAYGCINGNHVPIKTPNEKGQDYFNYRQFYSFDVGDFRGYFMEAWKVSSRKSRC